MITKNLTQNNMKQPLYRIPDGAQKVIDMYDSLEWENMLQIPVEKYDLQTNEIIVSGKKITSFGNVGYLGLNKDPRLLEAGIDAIRKYGLIYPSSRSFSYNNLYDEFESLLETIFGLPTITSTHTTMADLGAMSLLMLPSDVALVDIMAHATLQTVINIPKANGMTVDKIKHNDLNHLESKIIYYRSQNKEKIWYVIDSIYSMYGDCAPMLDLLNLLEKYDNFYLYIDDAHGMSWTGPNGAGFVSKFLPIGHPRVLIVTSFVKGFGVSGGALICSDKRLKGILRKISLNQVFCAPLTSQVLGSGIASAKIHLTNEIYVLQDNLKSNIEYFISICREYKLPLEDYSLTPIFYLHIGEVEIALKMVKKLLEKGFYVNLGSFPAVPVKKSGIRISLTSEHTKENIRELLKNYFQILSELLNEKNINFEDYFFSDQKTSLSLV